MGTAGQPSLVRGKLPPATAAAQHRTTAVPHARTRHPGEVTAPIGHSCPQQGRDQVCSLSGVLSPSFSWLSLLFLLLSLLRAINHVVFALPKALNSPTAAGDLILILLKVALTLFLCFKPIGRSRHPSPLAAVQPRAVASWCATHLT